MKQPYRNGKRVRGRCIDTDGGYFTITLPQVLHCDPSLFDPLKRAENFFQTAVHEWGHIRDYQNGGTWRLPWARKRAGNRRANWGDRPEERRAIRYTTEANERIEKGFVQSPDNAILDLALWLENTYGC
jgi:hypothetical protein